MTTSPAKSCLFGPRVITLYTFYPLTRDLVHAFRPNIIADPSSPLIVPELCGSFIGITDAFVNGKSISQFIKTAYVSNPSREAQAVHVLRRLVNNPHFANYFVPNFLDYAAKNLIKRGLLTQEELITPLFPNDLSEITTMKPELALTTGLLRTSSASDIDRVLRSWATLSLLDNSEQIVHIRWGIGFLDYDRRALIAKINTLVFEKASDLYYNFKDPDHPLNFTRLTNEFYRGIDGRIVTEINREAPDTSVFKKVIKAMKAYTGYDKETLKEVISDQALCPDSLNTALVAAHRGPDSPNNIRAILDMPNTKTNAELYRGMAYLPNILEPLGKIVDKHQQHCAANKVDEDRLGFINDLDSPLARVAATLGLDLPVDKLKTSNDFLFETEQELESVIKADCDIAVFREKYSKYLVTENRSSNVSVKRVIVNKSEVESHVRAAFSFGGDNKVWSSFLGSSITPSKAFDIVLGPYSQQNGLYFGTYAEGGILRTYMEKYEKEFLAFLREQYPEVPLFQLFGYLRRIASVTYPGSYLVEGLKRTFLPPNIAELVDLEGIVNQWYDTYVTPVIDILKQFGGADILDHINEYWFRAGFLSKEDYKLYSKLISGGLPLDLAHKIAAASVVTYGYKDSNACRDLLLKGKRQAFLDNPNNYYPIQLMVGASKTPQTYLKPLVTIKGPSSNIPRGRYPVFFWAEHHWDSYVDQTTGELFMGRDPSAISTSANFLVEVSEGVFDDIVSQDDYPKLLINMFNQGNSDYPNPKPTQTIYVRPVAGDGAYRLVSVKALDNVTLKEGEAFEALFNGYGIRNFALTAVHPNGSMLLEQLTLPNGVKQRYRDLMRGASAFAVVRLASIENNNLVRPEWFVKCPEKPDVTLVAKSGPLYRSLMMGNCDKDTRYKKLTNVAYDARPEDLYGFLDYDPNTNTMKSVRPSGGVGKTRYYGVEIELEAKYPLRFSEFAKDQLIVGEACGIVSGTDGSLNDGIEFRTCPQTMEATKVNLKKFFDRAKPNFKAKSTCGLHVHVSRASITPLQLGRVMQFVYHPNNQHFISTVARRESGRYQEFTSPTPVHIDRIGKVNKAKKGYSGNLRRNSPKDRLWFAKSGTKYTAINTLHPNTIEFRLFAGADNYQDAMSSIEFVDAIFKYMEVSDFGTGGTDNTRTKTAIFFACTSEEKFVEWLATSPHAKDYVHLRKHLNIQSKFSDKDKTFADKMALKIAKNMRKTMKRKKEVA